MKLGQPLPEFHLSLLEYRTAPQPRHAYTPSRFSSFRALEKRGSVTPRRRVAHALGPTKCAMAWRRPSTGVARAGGSTRRCSGCSASCLLRLPGRPLTPRLSLPLSPCSIGGFAAFSGVFFPHPFTPSCYGHTRPHILVARTNYSVPPISRVLPQGFRPMHVRPCVRAVKAIGPSFRRSRRSPPARPTRSDSPAAKGGTEEPKRPLPLSGLCGAHPARALRLPGLRRLSCLPAPFPGARAARTAARRSVPQRPPEPHGRRRSAPSSRQRSPSGATHARDPVLPLTPEPTG